MSSWSALMIICLAFFQPTVAKAWLLDDEIQYGATSLTNTLSGTGHFGEAKPDQDQWSWDLAYTHAKSESSDPNSAAPITDITSEIMAGGGFHSAGHFLADGALTYARTPAESMMNWGPSLSIGYEFLLGSAKDSGDESKFVPSLIVKANFSRLTYTQTFTSSSTSRVKGAQKTIVRPRSGLNEISQTGTGASVILNPVRWFSARATYTGYSYDKDVNRYLSYLDNSRAVRSDFASGMASLVDGFPQSTAELALSFSFAEVWTLTLGESLTEAITDKTKSWTSKLKVSRELGDSWEVGLGDLYETSSSTNENFLLASVGYAF